MTTKLFSELGLSPELLKAIDKLGFEKASPIQAAAIPVLMSGRDAVGQSQTGSGKTAAFAVPAIEKIDPNLRAVQALVLCPTRELAIQVAEEVHKLTLFKRGINALPIYGGQSYDRQFQGLRQGAQIVIGTPGRLMDHMRRGTLRLDKVKMVVLDEADVMLDMGFRDDIETILQGVPKERQTVFFSATMPRAIQELVQKYSKNPENVRIEQSAMTVPTVEQIYYEVDRRFKVELLTRLIDLHDLRLGIIFCNTKRMVDDLVDHLNAQGYSADRLHGDMTQPMRDRVMQKFRKSGLEFLVATDVAARGIDVEHVQAVFNYDLPYDGEDYLHRIGRTGRAGRNGMAISFASGREVFQIRQIERFTRVRMHRGKPPTATEVEEAKSGAFLEKLRVTLRGGEFKKQDQLIERLLEEGFASTDIASALLHHLQAGDAAAAPAAPAKEGHFEDRDSRPDRRGGSNGRFDRRDRGDEGGGRRDDRGPRSRGDFDNRAPRAPRPDRDRDRRSDLPLAKARGESMRPEPPRSASISPPSVAPRKSEPPRENIPSTPAPASAPVKKASRATPPDQTRIYVNVGETMGVAASDIADSIRGETGLPAGVVGTVDLRARHAFVDVSSEHANAIISKLNRARIKEHKLKAKVA
jgi:ATP-dependent RNA helicase DeaD